MSDTHIISTPNGNNHVANGPLTTAAIRSAVPTLLENSVDSRVVRIRPMATPIDQISRMIGARPASSMEVEYYSVDTRPGSVQVVSANPVGDLDANSQLTYEISTDNDRAIAVTDTLLLPLSPVDASEASPLVLYVTAVAPGKGITAVTLNLTPGCVIPGISAGDPLVRMGRAAAELDVQTPQFEALPEKKFNYCQIFKAQIEQSAFARMSAKEVGWSFSDQEEVAIMDMRLGMEKSFIFGSRMRITDPVKFDEVLFTGGIWGQAATTYTLNTATLVERDLISLMRAAFTGQAAGSTRKILIGGSALIEALNRLDFSRVVTAGDTVTRWGIDFSEIRSKFGSLYVIHSEVFDQCGHAADGMVIDPEYLTKYVHLPFRVEHLDLRKSGVRNTDALVATEASCLVLRHPKAHLRIVDSCNR